MVVEQLASGATAGEAELDSNLKLSWIMGTDSVAFTAELQQDAWCVLSAACVCVCVCGSCVRGEGCTHSHALETPTRNRLAVGFGSAMVGSTVIIGKPSDNSAQQYSISARSASGITVDSVQTVTETAVLQSSGVTTMEFKWPLKPANGMPAIQEGDDHTEVRGA